MQVHDDGKRLGQPPVARAPGSFLKSSHHITLSNDDRTLVDHSIYAVDKGDMAIPLLYLTDRHSGTRFLVDCGATVSIFPASLQDQMTRPQTSPLLAANGSHIATYGTREVRLDLGFRRTSCSFRLANVTKPILCLDFLSSECLAVNFNRRTLYTISPYAEAGRLDRASTEMVPCYTLTPRTMTSGPPFSPSSPASWWPTFVRPPTSTAFLTTSPSSTRASPPSPTRTDLQTPRRHSSVW